MCKANALQHEVNMSKVLDLIAAFLLFYSANGKDLLICKVKISVCDHGYHGGSSCYLTASSLVDSH